MPYPIFIKICYEIQFYTAVTNGYKTSSVVAGFGRHGMPRQLLTLTFDRLTLKLVCESRLWRANFLPNLGTLGLWILELFAMYATYGQKDGQTDKSNAYCPLFYGRGHNIGNSLRSEPILQMRSNYRRPHQSMQCCLLHCFVMYNIQVTVRLRHCLLKKIVKQGVVSTRQ